MYRLEAEGHVQPPIHYQGQLLLDKGLQGSVGFSSSQPYMWCTMVKPSDSPSTPDKRCHLLLHLISFASGPIHVSTYPPGTYMH